MALIVCNNCGQHISERAVKCPKCGFVVQKQSNIRSNTTGSPNNIEAEIIYQKAVNCLRDRKFEEAGDYIAKLLTIDPHNKAYQNLSKDFSSLVDSEKIRIKKRKRLVLSLILLIPVALLCTLGYRLYSKHQLELETEVWEQAVHTNTIDAYQNYLKKYTDGTYKHQADERIAELVEDEEKWVSISNSQNEHELYAFIRDNPNNPHYSDAKRRYDDLKWSKALQMNSIEGYEDYMDCCPNGQHYTDAEDKLDRLYKTQITGYEIDQAKSVVYNFYSAILRNDESKMLSYVNSSLTSFLGKKGATKVDVISYMKRLHGDDIFSVSININYVDIEKQLDVHGDPEYIATFSFDQKFNREDTSKETFASYDGTIIINDKYKIVSLSLKKTAHY